MRPASSVTVRTSKMPPWNFDVPVVVGDREPQVVAQPVLEAERGALVVVGVRAVEELGRRQVALVGPRRLRCPRAGASVGTGWSSAAATRGSTRACSPQELVAAASAVPCRSGSGPRCSHAKPIQPASAATRPARDGQRPEQFLDPGVGRGARHEVSLGQCPRDGPFTPPAGRARRRSGENSPAAPPARPGRGPGSPRIRSGRSSSRPFRPKLGA